MSNNRTTWDSYTSAWKEVSPQGKAAALQRSVLPTCVYQDPLMTVKGHDELITYMLSFHQQVPGGHFMTTWFLTHHDVSIAKWNMVSGDGTVIGDGISYGQYNEQGLLVSMTGFFETPQ